MITAFSVHGLWGDDGVRLTQDLHRLPPNIARAVVAALGERLHLHPLEKATPATHSFPDPVSPELFVLLERARADFQRHGARLVAEIGKLLNAGQLLPLDERNEKLLRELFADHEVGMVAEFAGHHWDSDRLRRLVKAGLVRADYAETATLPLGYRLGKGLEVLRPMQIAEDQEPALASIVERALRVPLTDADHTAIRHIRQRGAAYMRVPIARAQAGVSRELTAEEYRLVRGTIAHGLRKNRSTAQVTADLTAAAMHTQLTNDLDRVARTELHAAKSQGAFEELKSQSQRLGEQDPWVARQCDARACTHCRRLFGVGRDVKPYRLSEVEANTLAGGNFGRKAADYVPVIGPLHPQCRCAPWFVWSQDLVDDIEDLADLVESMFG